MSKRTQELSKYNSLYLPVLISIGIGIRMPSMFFGLDGDEGTNYTYFAALPWAELFTRYLDPQQHTLYIAIAYIFRMVFGESELVFRLPALLAAILSVVLIYKVSLKVTHSPFTSFLAATLLNFSFLNFEYSVRGRGYALTLFLSLLLINAVLEIYKNKHSIFWSLIFLIGGLLLVMTLPSNAFFLAGVSIFFLILKCKNEKFSTLVYSKKFYKEISFIIFTAVISLSYFGIIWSDLLKAVSIAENYAVSVGENIHWSFWRLGQAWSGLLQPWGGLMLVSFAYGVLKLRSNYYLKAFTGFLFFILVLQGILNILPPSRTIIFLLPVVLIISAYGIRRGLYLVKNFPYIYKNVALVLFWILVLIPAYFKFSDFHKERASKDHSAKIIESKQALAYLQNKIPTNSLIVLPTIDRALNHYLVKEVTKRNVDVIKNRKLENIFFIGPKEFKFLSFGAPMEDPKDESLLKSNFSKNIFEKFGEIGSIRISKFNGKILSLTLDKADPEVPFFNFKLNNPKYIFKKDPLEFVEGNASIKIINESKLLSTLKIPVQRKLNFKNLDWSLVLFANFQKYDQLGGVILLGRSPIFYYGLNELQGGFYYKNNEENYFESFPLEWHHTRAWMMPFDFGKNKWRLKLKIFPMTEKTQIEGLFFMFGSRINIFDGISLYLLTP